jgi:hypothetical protein
MNDRVMTHEAAELLGVRHDTLLASVRRGKIQQPAYVDAAGAFWWTAAEIKAARAALAVDLRRRAVRAQAIARPRVMA